MTEELLDSKIGSLGAAVFGDQTFVVDEFLFGRMVPAVEHVRIAEVGINPNHDARTKISPFRGKNLLEMSGEEFDLILFAIIPTHIQWFRIMPPQSAACSDFRH